MSEVNGTNEVLTAFPVMGTSENYRTQTREVMALSAGMTLRDYFAAKALAAMLANPNKEGSNCGRGGLKLFPEFAYEWADAMLKAREA